MWAQARPSYASLYTVMHVYYRFLGDQVSAVRLYDAVEVVSQFNVIPKHNA